jgi:kumamolisin
MTMTEISSTYRRLAGSELRPPPDARLVGPAEPDEAVTVRVCLRTRPDGRPLPGHEHWLATPPGQRNFPSPEEFSAWHGAAPQDLAAIAAFAGTHGLEVTAASVADRTVVLSGTAAQVSRAFAVELGRYESPRGTYRGHDGFIHLPEEIVDVVVAVFGLDNRRVGGHNTALDPPGAATFLGGPPQVAQLYNFPAPPPGITGQTIGIIEFAGGWQQSDINDTMLGNNNPDPSLNIPGWQGWLPPGLPALIPPTPTDVHVTGSNTPGVDSNTDGEVMLDICTASSVAPGANIRIYWGSDEPSVADWQAVLTAITDDVRNRIPHAPTVVTTSVYLSDGDDTATLGMSQGQVFALSGQLQALAALGVTVLAASGDDGARSLTTDGLRHVQYPGSDPWVTSCGGTSIALVQEPAPWIFPDYVEWVWNDTVPPGPIPPGKPMATGGGVSACFTGTRPAWQQAVNVPVSLNDNKTVGRGVPDVAGNASPNTGYPVVVQGKQTPPLAGTSAVAPLYAGLVTIVNANLSEPVGFLNPTLYAFADTVCLQVDDKDNPDSPQDNGVPGYAVTNEATGMVTNYPAVGGYPCTYGWDACTGLGTIDGNRLLGALQTVYQQYCWIFPRYPYGLGENQVRATLGGSTPGVLFNVFYVAVEGFTPADLGIMPGDLSGTPGVAPTITCSRAGMTVTATTLLAEDASLPDDHPQQFTWVCAAEFDTNLSAFTGVTGFGPIWVALTSSIKTVSGQIVSGHLWTPLVLREGGPVATG